MKSEDLRRFALEGARARLHSLREEESAILKHFPELARGGSASRPARRPMSEAARKAASVRMKKYWAAKRKAKKA
jgi:hypothetical protein